MQPKSSVSKLSSLADTFRSPKSIIYVLIVQKSIYKFFLKSLSYSFLLFYYDFLRRSVAHLHDVHTTLRTIDAFTADGVALCFRSVLSISVWPFDAQWVTFLHPDKIFPAVSCFVFFHRTFRDIQRTIFVDKVRNDTTYFERLLYQWHKVCKIFAIIESPAADARHAARNGDRSQAIAVIVFANCFISVVYI